MTASGAENFSGIVEVFIIDNLTGTATFGVDYASFLPTTISIDCGSVDCVNGTTATVALTINTDDVIEPDETVNLQIINTNGFATIGTQATFTATIQEASTATVSANDPDAAENPVDSGQFTVDLGGVNQTGTPITVSYSIGGTATAGDDYAVLSGSVQIANSERTATIDVTPLDDALAEGAETVIVTLTSTDNGNVSVDTTSSTVTITDDEISGVIASPNVVAFRVNESGFYTVVLTSQPTSDVIVNGYATNPCRVFPGSLTFTPTNWNVPQQMAIGSTVVGECQISHVVSSADAFYDGAGVSLIDVTVVGEGIPLPEGSDTAGLTNAELLAQVTSLPATGEVPYWRNWLVTLVALGIGLSLVGGVVALRRR